LEANVEYGFTQETPRVLIEFFKEITVLKEAVVTWVKPIIVCEVPFVWFFVVKPYSVETRNAQFKTAKLNA
jgi:hypothetical protein